MLYLTSTILILVLQTTLTTITALEHFAAVLRNKYALLPRTPEISGGCGIDKSMYMEVHPCAHSFNVELSTTYGIAFGEHTLEECTKIKSSAAWWSETCVPIRTISGNQKAHASSIRGDCFLFKPDSKCALALPEVRQPNAWKHPCEAGFLTADSLWYTKWHGMTYGECKAKPNVGAWQLRQLCHVFPGPWVTGEVPSERGDCFVLDKIPVGESYVEVHPCDKFFSHDRSTFFSVLGSPFTFHECKGHSEAVAWSHMDPHKLSNSECFPIVWKKQNRLLVDPDLQKKGLCFKFNVIKTPDSSKVSEFMTIPGLSDSESEDQGSTGVSVPYKHACEYGFSAQKSRWYSRHPTQMTLAQCGMQKNAAAWKGKSGRGLCFAFYWNSDRPNLPQMGEGNCYILDKVVPLGSQDPPPWIFTKYNPQDILHIA